MGEVVEAPIWARGGEECEDDVLGDGEVGFEEV